MCVCSINGVVVLLFSHFFFPPSGGGGGLDLFHYPGAGRLLFSVPAVVSHGQSDGGCEKLG